MRRPARLLATVVAAAAPVLVGFAPQVMSSPAAASEQTVDSVRLNGFEAALAARINNVRLADGGEQTVAWVRLTGLEAALAAGINTARRAAGLRALVVGRGATAVARRWSWQLARAETLSHNPRLVSALQNAGSAAWTSIAEN